MNKDNYGDKFSEHLLEQYKILVTSINNLGERRAQTNRFYISVLSGFLFVISFTTTKNIFSEFQNILIAAIALLGIILCIIWRLNIQAFGVTSYRRYNVLNIIEEKLPFPTFTKITELLKKDKKYIPMAKIELYVPFVLMIPYLLLLIYSIYFLFT